MSSAISEPNNVEDTLDRRAELVERMETLIQVIEGIYVAQESGARYGTGSGYGEDPMTALYELPVSIELTQRIEVVLTIEPDISIVENRGVNGRGGTQLVGVWGQEAVTIDVLPGSPVHRALEEFGESLPGDPRRAFVEPGLRYWTAS